MSEPNRQPHLSIVAASRNDDHGGNLFERMQLFVDGLADQARRFDLAIELVLVEWNPPADRPSLADALRWEPAEQFQLRVITVPPEVHRTVAHAVRPPSGMAVRPALKELNRMTMAAWDRVVLPKLHAVACGDFTLTSRDVWFAMRGYPEWPMYSWQLDGVPIYQAFAGGVEMINL